MGSFAEDRSVVTDIDRHPRDGAVSPHRPPWAVTHGRIEALPIASLLPADSPRMAGTDQEHVCRLMEVGSELPPILVQRSTRRVVDGMHRVQAAAMRGDDRILVQYFEGDDAESFVQSVRVNVAHGLPLSTGEREMAAERIIQAYPGWSDRAIAVVAGLSAPTVAGIRRRSTENSCQLSKRMGRDGRMRPVDGTAGRQKAMEIIRERPDASLREIAREAGISVGTAHNIRVKLRADTNSTGGESCRNEMNRDRQPVPSVSSDPAARGASTSQEVQRAHREILLSLRKDPSVRLTARGRFLLQWLGVLSVDADRLKQLVGSVPDRWVVAVARLAWDCSNAWQQLAAELERRTDAL
ncbi:MULTISPECIES: ParB N-terminal domain-containing protein [unclassified Streptomyces]|uniref:ParB N-terminal domain-containing protein n=1 Tax=unclassified Streptomyces TaxID=2593676 RepID=UPI0013180CAF|nr:MULTISPECIES: ParB N-terminal domain-containing protein [unclassified Streptomyces]QHC31807.1 ParB N-terminal domain-containing protein [Streptomyces sp. HF10]WKE69215.1 ParB N-terminal domain-containing protein [Streptomyces sp. WP-1]